MEKIAAEAVSFIVPIYNSERTLKRCLDSIFLSIQDRDEVILVNDGSTDLSERIMEKYECKKIDLGENRGVAFARNVGAQESKNEIIAFIDSDIVISKENVEKLKKYFSENKSVQTISCNVDNRKYMDDFTSDYKNLYMHYVLSGVGKKVNFVYGAFCATRSDGFLEWPVDFLLTEDSAWGYEQKMRGREIHFIADIQVMHIKQYNFSSLVLNDYKIAQFFTYAFLRFKRWSVLYTSDSFGHTSKGQILSVVIAALTVLGLAVDTGLALFGVSVWLLLNAKFAKYLLRARGASRGMVAILWTFIDHLIYSCGIATGVWNYLTNHRVLFFKKLPKSKI